MKGSKQAVIEITEESEDITLRLHGRKCSSSQIAVRGFCLDIFFVLKKHIAVTNNFLIFFLSFI